jgi:hypothetical protein
MTVMIVGGMSFLISCVDVVQAVTKTSSAVTPAPVPAAYTLGALPDNKSYSDFVVGPGKIELNLNPGDTRTVEITIANRLGTPRVFNVSEEDFTGSNDLNQPVVLLGDDRGPYSAKDVIHIPLSSVDIPHAEKAFIPVTVSIPANAQPGGLYGSVVVSVTSNPPSGTPPIGASTATNPVITRLAVLFFIRIAGPVSAEGQLSQFSLSGKKTILWNSDPVSFDMVYKNTGSIYLVPSGSISVTNMLGSPVAEIAVDPWFAMPASLRFREVTWAPPFLFGRYTAHAVINRGYASTSDQADLVFWVIPWKIILSVLIVLFIVIFGIRWIVTRFKFKIARK